MKNDDTDLLADLRILGYVTHGTDRLFWALRIPQMTQPQVAVAVAWLDAIDREIENVEREGKPIKPLDEVLMLKADKTIAWGKDEKYNSRMEIVKVLPGES